MRVRANTFRTSYYVPNSKTEYKLQLFNFSGVRMMSFQYLLEFKIEFFGKVIKLQISKF